MAAHLPTYIIKRISSMIKIDDCEIVLENISKSASRSGILDGHIKDAYKAELANKNRCLVTELLCKEDGKDVELYSFSEERLIPGNKTYNTIKRLKKLPSDGIFKLSSIIGMSVKVTVVVSEKEGESKTKVVDITPDESRPNLGDEFMTVPENFEF
jgi:hypothetical protein